MGSSARLRSVEWPVLDPRACAEKLYAEAGLGQVALIFGRESSGLTNEELGRCHHLVHIPTNEAYNSLNLGAAVQVLVYELYLASMAESGISDPVTREVASADAVQGFLLHLEQALLDLGFANPSQSRTLLQRLRRLFLRARPDRDELNILRGILSAAQGRKSMRRE